LGGSVRLGFATRPEADVGFRTPPLSQFVEGVHPLHPAALAAVAPLARPTLDATEAHDFIVYTDGSGGTEQLPASWAMLVLAAEQEVPTTLIGFQCGKLLRDLVIPTGAPIPEGMSMHAESLAIFQALVWTWGVLVPHASKAGWLSKLRITFRFDNTPVGFAVFRAQKVGEHYQLATVSVEMASSLRMLCTVGNSHAKAHSGEPYNEFVDSACSFASQQHLTDMFVTPSSQQLGRFEDWVRCPWQAAWAFLPYLDDARRAQYPPMHGDGCVAAAKPEASDILFMQPIAIASGIDQSEAPTAPSAYCTVPVKVVSVNVLTLKQLSKRIGIQDQMHTAGAHIVLAQETRSKKPGVAMNKQFISITGRCNNRGTHTCEIWLSRLRHFATCGPRKIKLFPKHVS